MCTEKGQNPTEKFTVPWLFSMDSHSPGFPGSSTVRTHLTPICHPISCAAPTASVPSRRKLEAAEQNAVIITLSTSSPKLAQGAVGNSSELNSHFLFHFLLASCTPITQHVKNILTWSPKQVLWNSMGKHKWERAAGVTTRAQKDQTEKFWLPSRFLHYSAKIFIGFKYLQFRKL